MLFPLDMCNADSKDGYVVLVRMTARALNGITVVSPTGRFAYGLFAYG